MTVLRYTMALIAACALCAPRLTARAEDAGAEADLPPMIVRGADYPGMPAWSPGAISIVTADDLSMGLYLGAGDAAAIVPGVSRAADSPWGADINIRGLSGESVVMLIDGVPALTATDINARFGLVQPSDIERIEVLKGPLSVLYGAGSMGGVVNIVTRAAAFSTPARRAGEISYTAADNPSGRDIFIGGAFENPDSSLYASYGDRDHDSYEDGDGRKVENSQFEDRGARFRLAWRVLPEATIEANLQYFEGHEIGIPGSGSAPLPAVADVTYPDTRRGMLSVGATMQADGPYLRTSTLQLYRQFIERRARIDNFPPGNALESARPQADHLVNGLRWSNTLKIGEHAVGTGIDAWWRRLENSRRVRAFSSGNVAVDRPLPETDYICAGAFVQDEWLISPEFRLNLGARCDSLRVDNESTPTVESGTERDANWSANAGAEWHAGRQLVLRTLAAAGYRAASLEERFQYLVLGGGITKLGNPNLDPERSSFLECAAEWRTDELFLALTVFNNELRDLIGEVQIDSATIQNANIDEARIRGVEAEARWQFFTDTELRASLAYADGRDTGEDTHLPGMAPLGGAVGLSWRAATDSGPAAKLSAEFAASQEDVPDGAEPAAGWGTLDAAFAWRIARRGLRHEIAIRVDNVLDKTYRNYLTTYRGAPFNEPGRAVSAGYRVIF